MYVCGTNKNNISYSVYEDSDEHVADAAGQRVSVSKGTILGQKPKTLKSVVDAQAVLEISNERFIISARNTLFHSTAFVLLKFYRLVCPNSFEYRILNDPEIFQDEPQISLVVERVE